MLEKFFKDSSGKDAYDVLIKFFDKHIKRVSNKGYYNSLQINTFMQKNRDISISNNSADFVQDVNLVLSKYKLLDSKNQKLVKDLVQIALEQKGFEVHRGDSDWSDNIHIIVSW